MQKALANTFLNEVGTQTLESVSDVFSKWSFCGDGL